MFEHYLDLPEKARMVVIDEMGTPVRCRFIRCSKLSEKEARASKNYINGITIHCFSVNNLMITILFGKKECLMYGYSLSFREQGGKKNMIYRSEDLETGWQVSLKEGTDLVQFAVEELKKWVKSYQKTVRKLKLNERSFQANGGTLRNVDFGIQSLDSLEVLEVYGDIGISQILPKLQRPLKILIVTGVENRDYLLEYFELVRQVQQFLYWWDGTLNNEQFLRLTAKTVCIHIGQLTERDISKIIRSWQDGTIGKDIKTFYWGVKDSNFNELKLLRLLRVSEHEPEMVVIKHFIQPEKSAGLLFNRRLDSPTIRFTTKRDANGRFL